MIDAEELPPLALACSLTGHVYYQTYLYCMKIVEKNILEQDEPHNIPLAAICAGYVAGVRHERKRQRKKATSEPPAPGNITGQEMELLAAWRMIGDEDKKLNLKMAKYWQKDAQKEKAASAGTPTA